MRFVLRVALLILIIGALVAPGSAFLSGYAYRQTHVITGCSSWTSNLTNYTIMFEVFNTTGISFNDTMYTNGHSQPSWYDLKFTNLTDGELDYWIADTNTTRATVYVKIPEIANSSSINTSIYVYYGNPLASYTGNGTNLFEFFDDFDDGSLCTTKWTSVTNGVAAPTEYSSNGGYLRLYSNAGNTNYQHLYTLVKFSLGHAIETVFAQRSSRYMGTIGFWDNNTSAAYDPGYNKTMHLVAGGYSTPSSISTWINSLSLSSSEAADTKYHDSLRNLANFQQLMRDFAMVGYLTDAVNNTTYYAGAGEVSSFAASYYIDLYFFGVRDAVYPEPLNLEWGDEYSLYDYIDFDKPTYALGEPANVTTYFPDNLWDTVNYTYYYYLFRSPDVSTPIDTISVISQAQSRNLYTEDYGVGTYYVILYLTHTGSGVTYFVDYDYADFVNGVTISGLVFNATSGASIAGAYVNVTQGSTTSSYVSTLAGYNTSTPLNIGQPILITGEMAGYNPYSTTFTPEGAADITKSIPLVPTPASCFWSAADNSTSIAGLVDQLPYYIPADGACVNLSNATWYSNITLGLTGWYMFEDLDNESSYSITACKNGFNDYSANITSGADNLTWYNFTLGASFDLTVYIEDEDSGAPITDNVTVELESTTGAITSDTTTTGSVIFTGLAGGYTATASCSGYVPGSVYVNMDSDKNITISLSAQTGSNTYYTPHDVQIIVQDNFGNPKPDTLIAITPIETTLSEWSWTNWLLGVPESVDLESTPMSGTADSKGSCTFVMVKEIKYKIDIDNTNESIDETYYLFPKDDLYIFIVGADDDYENPTTLTDEITWTLSNTTINATYGNLTLQYYDASNCTTNLSFWVKSHTSPVTTCYQTYCSNPNSCNVGYVCGADNGQDYYWGFDAVTTNRGNITASQSITYQKLVNLGINTAYYPWIAAAFLIVIAAVFSVISVKFGAVLIPIFAFLFFYMKWINLTWQQTTLFTVLLVIGVFAYIRKQEDKVGN